jgi:hypothetical protein
MEKSPTFVLTRYLYVKDDVLASLCTSILDKDVEQAAFWTCELYYSGFETIVVEYLHTLYQQFFKSNNPRLEPFIQKMKARIGEGAHIAVTIAHNLAVKPRKFTVHDFAIHNIDPEILQGAYEKETRILVHIPQEAMEKYKTRDMGATRNWKFLEQVCLYETRKDMMNIFGGGHRNLDTKYMCEMHRMDKHWVYCATFSPIWMKRVQEHNGTIDDETKTVIFEDDDDLENFFELYGYEPDEQSVQIQRRLMHVTKYKQLTMGGFCRHYDTKSVKSVRKSKECVTHQSNIIHNKSGQSEQHATP